MQPVSNGDAWLRPWLTAVLVGERNLCLLLAHPGVGKTAFLVQLAIDELLGGNDVLHVSLGKALAQVEAKYEHFLHVRLEEAPPALRERLRVQVARRRAIQALATSTLDAEQLRAVLHTYRQHLKLRPRLLVVDGIENLPSPSQVSALQRLVSEEGLELWLSVRLGGELTKETLAPLQPQVALAVLLEPCGSQIQASLLWSPSGGPSPSAFRLEAECMRPQRLPPEKRPPASEFTLLSGAAAGAEAAFGELAEAYGLEERNFTFAGRECARQRGLVVLKPEELLLGDVSFAYLTARTGRSFETTEYLRRVLQSIWHQVNPAGEVFCIGEVLPERSVKGGTGWAVELAKLQQKPVWVFDQKLACWYEWFENDWRLCDRPCIRHFRFCGTGTRRLNPTGRRAIEELFQRSFG